MNLTEICRRSLLISNLEELVSINWNNQGVTAIVNRGLHLFTLGQNLRIFSKDIELKEIIEPCSTDSPATSLIPQSFIRKGLPNHEMIALLTQQELWPHNPDTVKNYSVIIHAEWSPEHFTLKNQRIIAMLNNMGNVNLSYQYKYGLVEVSNVSSFVLKHCERILLKETAWENYPKNIEQVKQTVRTVETSAMCWGHQPSTDMCYLVTAQKTGGILFWLIKTNEQDLSIELQGNIQSEIEHLTILMWIQLTDFEFVLLCCSLSGQIYAMKCNIRNGLVTILHYVVLWKYNDKMPVKSLTFEKINNNIVICCSKNRHLVVMLLDKHCTLLSKHIENIDDHKINDICKTSEDEYLVVTAKNVIYKLVISCLNNTVKVNLSIVTIKMTVSDDYEYSSISLSPNRVSYVIGLNDRRILHRKDFNFLMILFATETENIIEDNVIMDKLVNSNAKIVDLWDCIELIRMRTMRHKILPNIDYEELYNSNDINKIRLYYIFAVLYCELKKYALDRNMSIHPEISEEIVKDKLFALHCPARLQSFYEKLKNKKRKLEKYESEFAAGVLNYLTHYCNKYNISIKDFLSEEKLSVIKQSCKTIKYECQSCDEIIIGYTCANKHLNMFCSQTFTPIESNDYLLCEYCNLTARIELLKEKPVCVLCQSYLKVSEL